MTIKILDILVALKKKDCIINSTAGVKYDDGM